MARRLAPASEQERSCDDAVVTAGAGQSAYAEHLVALAGSLSQSAMGMAEISGLEQRIRALLDPYRKRQSVSRKACVATLVALVACAIPFAALRAQDSGPRVSLSGSVYDPSGAIIPDATVLLKNLTGKGQEIARANAAGQYHFDSIPASHYDVEVNARGFARYRRPALDLTTGATATANFNLEIGSISETIDVVGTGRIRPHAALVRTHGPHRGRRARTGHQAHTHGAARLSALRSGRRHGRDRFAGSHRLQARNPESSHRAQFSRPQLTQAAIDAVQQWTYEPTLLNGSPCK